ncbi:MAG: hypothetical protein HQK89_16885 [Nitrospirae bacterium]|nr:hypothetical protein [Nitrospirota bacterium]
MPITIDLEENEMYKDALQEGQRRGERKGLMEGVELGLEIKYGTKGLEVMTLVRNIFGNDATTERLDEFKKSIKSTDSADELKAFLTQLDRK